jgi:murein DD-endopeptidase MepM/ murein hydrolase activator NlpD
MAIPADLPSVARPVAGAAAPVRADERQQALALVQQFEAMLLTEMLRGLNEPEESDDDGGVLGLGGSTLTDTMTSALGQALSQGGGIGLADSLAAVLARQQAVTVDGSAAPPSIGPAPAAALVPVAASVAADPSPTSAAAVSSAFGWRADPLNGERRFHAGVDLRLAYGSPVQALADGTVRLAEERPGYGLLVVVDHGDGRETRYAHLSALGVAAGDRVRSGETIARSGNSGRSTGAHLHIEARIGNRPVDPRVTAEWTGVGEPALGLAAGEE